MAIGVFGLQVAYKLKRAELLSTDDTHGWIGGGFTAGPVSISTVDRIDFSNDLITASVRSPLSSARYRLAATGNSNYGWFGGGTFGTGSSLDRIDFSNDSSNVSPRGPLSSGRYTLAATGNSNYGWFGGGMILSSPTIPKSSTVDRVDYANDSSISSPRGPLSSARGFVAATGNSNYGWFGGGDVGPVGSPAPVSTVDRVDFSNDFVSASPRSLLTLSRHALAATGNSNYGWFGGGSAAVTTSRVDRVDFSNDSLCLVRGTIATRSFYAATANSNYGWWTGGTPTTSLVYRIDFSNDLVAASQRGFTSAAKGGSSAASGQAKNNSIKSQKTGNYGWWGGGSGPISTVQRLDFSNDLASPSTRGLLSIARSHLAATGNSNYGWFSNASSASLDRINFSSDLTTAISRGQSAVGENLIRMSASSNSDYGWFGGGSPSPSTAGCVSYVTRVNFSNDSIARRLRGNLSQARNNIAATGNSNYGWFGGGRETGAIDTSTVDRINYSNDLGSASPRGQFSSGGRTTHAAVGNSNYGWFSGGQTTVTFERINFSNDLVNSLTTIASPSLAAIGTGNNNYGWFDFGDGIAYKLDFSNDSSLTTRGPLTGGEYGAATSNTPVG
jgi:hypothetical protein